MTRKYYVSAYEEVKVGDRLLIKSTNLVIKAQDRAEAERKVREKGYTPFNVIRAK